MAFFRKKKWHYSFRAVSLKIGWILQISAIYYSNGANYEHLSSNEQIESIVLFEQSYDT